ncbi:MAG: phosphoribosylanthranilate isomerase [Firmicutes bacterium]|nr:phosphoribosylanthranilate isomerase [[Eubacterium] siraeum]MCM1487649.1 phosphoribosylanthranilate isomerase [Bacillota bacterium]
MKIKICGLKRAVDIEYANRLKPDYIGFVFWQKSRRWVSKEEAAVLKSLLDKSVKAVGVFVNEKQSVIADIAAAGITDLVQLHGDEDEEFIKSLRTLLPKGTKIIKAFLINSAEDIEAARKCSADYVLLDNGKGTGKTFCWDLLKDNMPKNAFLAGGINTENIYEAAKLMPYCLDVSSGAETDGLKDYEKMKSLIVQAAYVKD